MHYVRTFTAGTRTGLRWALSAPIAALAVALGIMAAASPAGATGVTFTTTQQCATDGIDVTVTLANPTDFPLLVTTSNPAGLGPVIAPHSSSSVHVTFPTAAAGQTEWADVDGTFVGHLGDTFYGTPGQVDDLPWSDGTSYVLAQPNCTPATTTTTEQPDSTVVTAPAPTGTTTIVNLPPETVVPAQTPTAEPTTTTTTVVDVPCCPAGTTGSSTPELAFTGTGALYMAVGGLMLVALGVILVRAGRRAR